MKILDDAAEARFWSKVNKTETCWLWTASVGQHKQNVENQAGPSVANKSGVRGVHWHAQMKQWYGQVQHDKVRYSAGLHASIEAAEAAVIALRNRLHTHNDVDRNAA